MSRDYSIKYKYLMDSNEKDFVYHKSLKQNENLETTSGFIDLSIQKKLPVDIDIFAELPRKIYDYPKVEEFLRILRNVILSSSLENVTLSKLHVSEFTDKSITIEWIFNYFRAYFLFELNSNNDSYGMIKNNLESAEFSSSFKPLQISNYEEIARSVVDYIVKMGGFERGSNG